MIKDWYIYAKKADFDRISRRFGIDKVTARVLRNRGLMSDEEIDLFLNGSIDSLYDERELPNAEKAADLILKTVRDGKKIRVVGDYDIDGVCSTYIMLKILGALGARTDCEIPDRITDGYGINPRIIDEAVSDGIELIITVDNGIAAIEELEAAKEKGLSVVVTDHHDVRTAEDGTELLPPCDALVDPKLSASRYPSHDICGAVVAWKLGRLLLRKGGSSIEVWDELLPFAAIATVGDIMPLTGENRIIVKEGLRRMNESPEELVLGLRELIRACDIAEKEITAYHIGFVIGPCINASGRLSSAYEALELFLSRDEREAAERAERLKALNEDRKNMTERGVLLAEAKAEERYKDDKVLVIELPKLHESLAGIVAGRIREKFGKPTIVITDTDTKGISKGSGRSIEAYHMFLGLQRVQDLLVKFGGHPMAAGLSLRTEDIGELRQRLNDECGLKEDDLREKIWIDAAMPISYVSEKLITELSKLAPFGNGNERPLFAQKDLIAYDLRIFGKNKNVLKLLLREEGRPPRSAIMFGDAEELKAELCEKERISVLYYPQINEYGGKREIQIVIRDFR